MATQSIMQNIIINDPKDAETFINALEAAMQNSEPSITSTLKSEDLTGEDLKKYLGGLLNSATKTNKYT